MRNAKFLLVALALVGCTQAAPFPTNTGAIVSQDIVNQAACGRLPQYDDGAWTPEPAMIAPLESALIERLKPELERDAEFFNIITPEPSDYYRRYAGVTYHGRRLIVICGEVRSMYDERGMDWRTQTIPYRDGGSGSFGAHYNPGTDEIEYFEFGFVG